MYKTSNYNYVIDYKGKKLLFNGIKGAGICMTLSEWQYVDILLKDLPFFEKHHFSDFERFKEMGYIIDSELDELSFLKYKNKIVTYNDRDYNLTINPTLECNFKCWYCYEDHNEGHMTIEVIEAIKLHIKKLVENHVINALRLCWFGGEPFLYFYDVVYPISQYAKQICCSNGVFFSNSATTNAYCIDENMVKKMDEIDLYNFQITLDGNRERHNKIRNNDGKPSYDRIIENIRMICLSLHQSMISLRINYDNATFKSNLEEILGEFTDDIKSKITIDLHRVWQTYNTTEAKENCRSGNSALNQFVEKAVNLGYKCHCHGSLIIGTYCSCYASKTNFVCLNYDGKIYKCTACSFTDTDCFGILRKDGEIEWNEARISRYYGFSPLEKKKCLECKFLPLCMGPCPKHFMENNYNVDCAFEMEERTPEERIIDLYEETLRNKTESGS